MLLTRHFREPIALATSKLFVEDVVMGSEEKLTQAIDGFIEKNKPALIGVLSSGLSEVKGDDVESVVRRQESVVRSKAGKTRIIHIPTPDFDGGLETGYARAVEAVIQSIGPEVPPISSFEGRLRSESRTINIIAGSHLTPADFSEIREIIEDFGMRAIILPDLSAWTAADRIFLP